MPNLLCTVAIPTRELFSGEIAYAEVPGIDGSYGVLKGHEMMVSTNRPGVLTLWLDAEGKEKKQFALYEGATQVYSDRVTVLGRFGVELDNIDVEAVRKKADEIRVEIEELSKKGEEAPKASLATHRAKLNWYETQMKIMDGSLK